MAGTSSPSSKARSPGPRAMSNCGSPGASEPLDAAPDNRDTNATDTHWGDIADMTEIATQGQLRMSYLRWALVTVPAIVLIGSLMGLLSNSGYGNRWFAALDQIGRASCRERVCQYV